MTGPKRGGAVGSAWGVGFFNPVSALVVALQPVLLIRGRHQKGNLFIESRLTHSYTIRKYQKTNTSGRQNFAGIFAGIL